MLPLPSRLAIASASISPRHAAATVLALSALLVLAPRSALALELALESPRIRADTVWADVRITNPFSPRIEESLLRGMPATLLLHTELWHRRSMWFDRVENTLDAELRIRYEVWSHTFFIERRGAPPVTVGTLDSLNQALARPLALPVGRLHEESAGGRHFVVVTAILKPLSVEDVAEVENWLSGEVENQRRSGFGLITQVPAALFDTVRNLAGFGDDRVRAISEDFTLPAPLEDQ
jgi:hypothetical protein